MIYNLVSVFVNLLIRTLTQLARAISPQCDIEIVEDMVSSTRFIKKPKGQVLWLLSSVAFALSLRFDIIQEKVIRYFQVTIVAFFQNSNSKFEVEEVNLDLLKSSDSIGGSVALSKLFPRVSKQSIKTVYKFRVSFFTNIIHAVLSPRPLACVLMTMAMINFTSWQPEDKPQTSSDEVTVTSLQTSGCGMFGIDDCPSL